MDPDPVAIRSVEIENFRGFQTRQSIDLAASAVLVSGSNGKGKTSFFDALQWLLLGSLNRLADLANRRSGDYLVNRFAGPGAHATVVAELQLGDRTIVLKRSGDQRSSLLEFTEMGKTLTAADADHALREALLNDRESSLQEIVLTSGILQQDVVRAVLEDEPKNRYRHMAGMLGLEQIAGFEDAVRQQAEEQGKLAKQAREGHARAEGQLRTAETDLARLEQRLSTHPAIEEAKSQFEAQLALHDSSLNIESLPAQVPDVVALSQRARDIRAKADRLLTEAASLREQEADAPEFDSAHLAAVALSEEETIRELVAAQQSLQVAQENKNRAEQQAGTLAELAALAIPLLGEHCPVCRQPIEADEIEEHLRELIDLKGQDLPALGRAATEAEQRERGVQAKLVQLRLQREQLQAFQTRALELDASRERWREACQQLADEELVHSDPRSAIADGETVALERLQASADQLIGVLDQLSSLLGNSGLGEEAELQRVQVGTLRTAVAELAEQAARTSRQAEEAKTLSGAATRAIAGVTRVRFGSLQPLVDDIFARLAPHPAFTTLGFDLSVSYRAGVADPFVTDPESGVRGDPLLLFSSSQANVAALTYFLALSWAADTRALPFLLLDDPLQSMDDVNTLGFSDLCRHVRRRRQLVVSTHEDRLANLLERKLAPRAPGVHTKVVRFTGWDREGPTIEQSDVDAESVRYLLQAG